MAVLPWKSSTLDVSLASPLVFGPGKTFQKRSVSSPAPVTIVCPSGLIAKYNTRSVCPVSVATFCIDEYRHTTIWF